MKTFSQLNPIVTCVYFLSHGILLAFCANPIMLISALVGIITYRLILGKYKASEYLWALLFLLIGTAVNPLFSHNGKTVLLFVNDIPITLESIIFGAVNTAIIITTIYIFLTFSDIMTSDKLLYVFGKLSPKLALIISMSIRSAGLMRRRYKRILMARETAGLGGEGFFGKIKFALTSFSVLAGWGLERGITSAASMSARGYGSGKRSAYSIFRFRPSDLVVLSITLLLAGVVVLALALGAISFEFYPSLSLAASSLLGGAGYSCYVALSLVPVAYDTYFKVGFYLLTNEKIR